MIWTGRRSAAGTVYRNPAWKFYQVEPLTPAFRLGAPGGDYVLTVLDNHDVVSADRLSPTSPGTIHSWNTDHAVVPTLTAVNRLLLPGRPVILKRWISGRVIEPLPLDRISVCWPMLAQLHMCPIATIYRLRRARAGYLQRTKVGSGFCLIGISPMAYTARWHEFAKRKLSDEGFSR